MVANDLIEVWEAATLLGVSESMMRIYLRAGKFKTAKKIRGTLWRVSRKEIQIFVDGDGDVDFSGAWGEVYGKGY